MMLLEDHLRVLSLLSEESDIQLLNRICNQNPIIAEDLIEAGYLKATVHKPLSGEVSFFNPKLSLIGKMTLGSN